MIFSTLCFQVDAIFSSPLSRAAQTALISLDGHPSLVGKGMKLYRLCRQQTDKCSQPGHLIIFFFERAIREIKNIGGLDTVGKAVGKEIAVRLRHKFSVRTVSLLLVLFIFF